MQQGLNEQIMKEFYSGYLYLSMEAYFTSQNLDGFANWFRVQAQEERDHAMKIFNYVNYVGGRVKLLAIKEPVHEFGSAEEVLRMALEHEKKVTASIYELVDMAREERDHKTDSFLQWYVDEQVEEENNAQNNVNRLKLAGERGGGLFMIDQEMGKRVYAPIVTEADGEEA